MVKNNKILPSYSSPRHNTQYTQKNVLFTRKNRKVMPFPNLKEFLFYLVPFSHNPCFPANFFLSKWTTFACAAERHLIVDRTQQPYIIRPGGQVLGCAALSRDFKYITTPNVHPIFLIKWAGFEAPCLDNIYTVCLRQGNTVSHW